MMPTRASQNFGSSADFFEAFLYRPKINFQDASKMTAGRRQKAEEGKTDEIFSLKAKTLQSPISNMGIQKISSFQFR